MPYDRLISIGNYCETAAQIRRFTGNDTPALFDWMLTNLKGLIACIDNNFADFFKLPNLRACRNDSAVIDTATGFEFAHHFGTKGNRKILPGMIERDFRRTEQTLRFMIQGFNECLDEEYVLLIRQGDASTADILRLYAALERAHPTGRFDLLLVNNGEVKTRVDHPKIRVDAVRPAAPGPLAWVGDDESWNAVFARHAPDNACARELLAHESRPQIE